VATLLEEYLPALLQVATSNDFARLSSVPHVSVGAVP
jgi:hypothetical protein